MRAVALWFSDICADTKTSLSAESPPTLFRPSLSPAPSSLETVLIIDARHSNPIDHLHPDRFAFATAVEDIAHLTFEPRLEGDRRKSQFLQSLAELDGNATNEDVAAVPAAELDVRSEGKPTNRKSIDRQEGLHLPPTDLHPVPAVIIIPPIVNELHVSLSPIDDVHHKPYLSGPQHHLKEVVGTPVVHVPEEPIALPRLKVEGEEPAGAADPGREACVGGLAPWQSEAVCTG